MKNKEIILLSIIIIGLTLLSFNIGALAATLFTVNTNSGSLAVSSTSGVLPIAGINGIKTSVVGSSVLINETRIITTGQLEQIRWGSESQNNYLSGQMEIISQYPELVANSEPFSGNVTTVSITPLINTMQNRMILTLMDNGISTGKTIIIPAESKIPIISSINQPFIKGDSLSWKITTLTTDTNSLLFNAQVLINYNG